MAFAVSVLRTNRSRNSADVAVSGDNIFTTTGVRVARSSARYTRAVAPRVRNPQTSQLPASPAPLRDACFSPKDERQSTRSGAVLAGRYQVRGVLTRGATARG